MAQDLTMYTRNYYLHPGKPEGRFGLASMMRPDQASALCYCFAGGRTPKRVLSIGCGLGLLERLLHRLGVEVIATDPAPCIAKEEFPFAFHNIDAAEAMKFLPHVDTVIFCESMEHIPKQDIGQFMRRVQGRMIVTNWLDFWPIGRNGKDHLTLLNDPFYDWLTKFGKVIFRMRSHLVLEIKNAAVRD